MSPARFTFALADGTTLRGPVRGCGGMLTAPARLEAACRMAEQGRPTGLYEPEPGHVAVYPDYCAAGDGDAVSVPLSALVALVVAHDPGALFVSLLERDANVSPAFAAAVGGSR